MRKLFLATALMLGTTISWGAAFQLNLQGLRQLAMGGSGTAWTWDASSIFYNPGGLSDLKGTQAYASLLFIVPSTQYAHNGYTANSVAQVFTPFNVYVGGPLSKNGKWSLGLGIYTPFGSGLKWDDNWEGRYMAQSISLQSIFAQPTISYKFSKNVSFGVGLIYAYGIFDFKEALPTENDQHMDGQAHLSGNAHGYGFNLGLHVTAGEHWQFGFTYRSQVNMGLDNGKAQFTVPASLRDTIPNTKVDASLPLPQVASIGIGYRPGKKLTLQLDLNYVGWNSYDSLRFNFGAHTGQLKDMHLPREYHNTLTTRIGANYNFGKVSLMAGAAWDPTPSPDGYVSPELPDADRFVVTGGFSYTPSKHWTILGAVEYTTFMKRDAQYNYFNFNGKYQSTAITPGIGATYNF